MAEKSPEAFRTISEVAEEVRVPAHVLRFWESRFTQIRPVKRTGGRRYYRPEDVELIAGIKRLLHDHGMTIRGVQKLLKDHGTAHVAGMAGTGPGPGEPGALPGLAPFAPPPALAPSGGANGTLDGDGWAGGERRLAAHYQAEPLPRPPVRAVAAPSRGGVDGHGDMMRQGAAPALTRPAAAEEGPAASPALSGPVPGHAASDPALGAVVPTVAGAARPAVSAPAASAPSPAGRPNGAHAPGVQPAASTPPADPPARPRLSLSQGEAGDEAALTAAGALALLFAIPARVGSDRAERLRPIVARLAALRDRLLTEPPANPQS